MPTLKKVDSVLEKQINGKNHPRCLPEARNADVLSLSNQKILAEVYGCLRSIP